MTDNVTKVVDDYRLKMGDDEFVPIIVGGMGVDISTADLALEACRLGGIGHISDAMSPFVGDQKYGSKHTKEKANRNKATKDGLDKSTVKFQTEDLMQAQREVVQATMARKNGDGAVFINIMEKLNMGAPLDTLRARLNAALEGGIDGITLSAGLHTHSMGLMKDNPRFRDAKIGTIVSSVRALKIFLRSARRVDRMPDYVIVEGPLAGGHLGFGDDWAEYSLTNIVAEVLQFLRDESLDDIVVVPAGGIFTGTDAAEFLAMGAGAVQVATRFTVTEEAGLPDRAKQHYFAATEDEVYVSSLSPTGYPLRMLTTSPCIDANTKPQCEPFGYILDGNGDCAYLDAYEATGVDERGRKLPVTDKVCLCYHFSKFNCYTCGHYVYRLKDTSRKLADGSYQLLSAEHVFKDYQFSREHEIVLPPEDAIRFVS